MFSLFSAQLIHLLNRESDQAKEAPEGFQPSCLLLRLLHPQLSPQCVGFCHLVPWTINLTYSVLLSFAQNKQGREERVFETQTKVHMTDLSKPAACT